MAKTPIQPSFLGGKYECIQRWALELRLNPKTMLLFLFHTSPTYMLGLAILKGSMTMAMKEVVIFQATLHSFKF